MLHLILLTMGLYLRFSHHFNVKMFNWQMYNTQLIPSVYYNKRYDSTAV